ncbi:MAG: AI-2E family transporter [Rhizobiales bacterium]|nr:AI-2E family transporter [Hyphomicrobiales bacterium]
MNEDQARFATFVLAVLLVFFLVWVLVIGQGIILPIFTAIISVYVLATAATAMGRLPLLRHLPSMVRRLLVLAGFVLCLVGFGFVISTTVDQLIAEAPSYKDNLAEFGQSLAGMFGLKAVPSWEQIRNTVFPQLDLKDFVLGFLGSVTSLGSGVFLVIVYSIFLIAEEGALSRKVAVAFPKDRAERITALFGETNRKIGDYLAMKTLVNVILGAVSYVIMLAMGIDFALFWAVTIALFNYIPFVGTVAVFFPIVLSLAQFGSLTTTLVLAALLFIAQLVSDNVLEPKLYSRQLNLSPFVIIAALSFWTAVWGLPGAILAIPITSMIAIICDAFPATRFIAIFLAERLPGEDPAPARKPARRPRAKRVAT